MTPLDEVNSLPFVEFAAALTPLFETAPPLAEALYAERPFRSYDELVDTAESLAVAMADADRVAVLSAHPRIGANPATLSQASFREQGYSSNAAMDSAEMRINAELADLNQQYEQKFGFRFVVFVNRRPRTEIVKVLRQRLQGSREQELSAGLQAMFQIARDRLASAAQQTP